MLDIPVEGISLRAWLFHELRRRHALELVDHMLRLDGRAHTGVQNVLRTLSAMAEDAITDEITDAGMCAAASTRAFPTTQSRRRSSAAFTASNTLAGRGGADRVIALRRKRSRAPPPPPLLLLVPPSRRRVGVGGDDRVSRKSGSAARRRASSEATPATWKAEASPSRLRPAARPGLNERRLRLDARRYPVATVHGKETHEHRPCRARS